MIFSPELAEKVLTARKTVTRRRTNHRNGRSIRYVVGGVYAVQPGRGKRHLGHISVKSVSFEPLGAITSTEAQAEGFGGMLGFITYWMKLHGSYNPREIVARIEFVLSPNCPKCSAEHQRLARERYLASVGSPRD